MTIEPVRPTQPSIVAAVDGSGAKKNAHKAMNTHSSVETDTKTI